MKFRRLDLKKDLSAVRQIWEEIGWIDRDEDDDAKYLEIFLAASNALVADIKNNTECVVTTTDGSLRHLDNELSLNIVASVTTSLIARKQGLASRMTAALIAEAAQSGSDLSALGRSTHGD